MFPSFDNYHKKFSPLEESDFDTSSVGKSLDLQSLSNIRKNNINRLILAHISINSVRNKFDQLVVLKKSQCSHAI